MVFVKGADFEMRIEPFIAMMRFDIFVDSHNFTYEVDFMNVKGLKDLTAMAVSNYIQVER